MKSAKGSSRRRMLQVGATLGTGLFAGGELARAVEQGPGQLGTPLGPYGERSPFEKAVRYTRPTKTPETGSSSTPLQDSVGTLTPSSLHYERHHAGIPAIDPARHRLVIHGMVARALVLTMDEIKRLPSVSRVLVVECGGNSGSEWGPKTGADVQRAYGLASCSEWTGVPLSLVLSEVGVRPEASWIIAEGADASHMQRSIPVAKAMDNILLAYGQNGEAIRPAQGYPLRLIIPGWEGNANVKWLASAEGDQSAPHDAGRNLEVFRPDAGRQGEALHVPDGGEVCGDVSIRRAEAAWPRSLRVDGAGLVRAWKNRAPGDHDRRRPDLVGRATAGAAPSDRVHALPATLALGRP